MTAFSRLPRNARVCVLIEPLWAMFGPLVIYYAPIYQKARGLDAVQMGTINSAAIAAGFVFFLLASPVTDRLGRRWTSLIFDLLSWTAAMLVWAFARSFVWFLAAAVLNALVRIVIVSWNMLITEDAQAGQRSTIHGWMYLISSTGGIVTFAGGLFVSRFGVLRAMPVIYVIGSISMTVMFILRHFSTVETKAGLILMARKRDKPFLPEVFSQFHLARKALANKRFLSSFFVYVIANSIYSMDFYRVLFLGEVKHIAPTVVALIPAVGAVLSLGVFFFLLPRLEARAATGNQYGKDAAILAKASLFCAVCQIAVILLPDSGALPAILAVGMIQSGFIVLQTFRDAVFLNGTGELERGSLYSLIQALTFLVSIPAGWLGGFLYSKNVFLPFIVSLALYLASYAVARSMGRMAGKEDDASASGYTGEGNRE